MKKKQSTKKTKSVRLDGKNKLVRFTKKLEADIRSFCRDKNIESESELIRHAVGTFIYSDYSDETLKLQGLKKTQDQISELKDMLEIIFKYLKITHINTLAYFAEIDSQYTDAAFRSATNRHEKLFNVFQDSIKNDPPLFERLLHKYYSGDFSGND